MSSLRQTNNSHSVALFSDLSPIPVSAGTEASSSLTVVSLAAQPVLQQLHLCLGHNLADPVFLVTVVHAVKVVLAADKTSASSDVATVPVSMTEPSSSSPWCVSGAFLLNIWTWALVR